MVLVYSWTRRATTLSSRIPKNKFESALRKQQTTVQPSQRDWEAQSEVPQPGISHGKEAVCVVFEKVNTGGKPLDAFELVTAMYAAEGHELRKDWLGDETHPGRQKRFAETLRPADSESGIIALVSNTDFLQAVSLFYTRERRREAELAGKTGKELPAVTGNREALLNLPLMAYKKFEGIVEIGFTKAAKFLHLLHIYRIFDLPYQSQIVPLAAILADIGDAWEHQANREKLVRWYWNGVFGELYGSAVETRIARDFMRYRFGSRAEVSLVQ
jgi:hypothetical protein